MEMTSAGNENDSAFAHLRRCIATRAEEAQVEVSAELVAGLRQMVNNPDFSDVVFLCNDGNQVCASRIHLAASSEVLKSLLKNGMAESNLSEIELPEISSPAMLSVVEFLYISTLDGYRPKSWKMGWEVIRASQFFLLPKLEILVRQSMHAQIAYVADDLPEAAILLTESLGFNAICEQGDEILVELVTILNSNWSDSIFVHNLSEDVFRYLLVNTRKNYETRFEEEDIFSFREYLRFRQVINWWVCRSTLGAQSKEDLMSFLVPDKEEVMSMICECPEILETVERPKEDAGRLLCDWNSLQSDEAPMGAAIRLLTNIEYMSIHPEVLAKVVEPLKISSGEVLNAFRFHARRRYAFFNTPIMWKKHHSYSTSENGRVICNTRGMVGLAVMNEPITSLCPVYEWELVIEDDHCGFVELGFVSRSTLSDLESTLERQLCNQIFAWVLIFTGKETKVTEGQGQHRNTRELQVQRCYTRLRVSFIFDTRENTCSLSINGQDFGVVWRNLWNSRYYPAVSFGACHGGRIRVKLGRGFASK